MSALPIAFVLTLAARPECGARPGIEPARIAAVASRESGGDPTVIHVNEDRARGLSALVVRSATPEEAAARAGALLADHRSVDLGLTGINASNLARDGLTLATAFNACASLAAAYRHLGRDFEAAAWDLSHRLYNCGRTDCSAAYAQSVEREVQRIRGGGVAPVASLQTPLPSCPDTRRLSVRVIGDDAPDGPDADGGVRTFVHFGDKLQCLK